MATVLPGTTIELSVLQKNSSRNLFDGIFAAGGISLSQVSVMTGLEPYIIQNWVKRGFVSAPVKRQYTQDQFARIVTINMLKESLQLDRICKLLSCINGALDDDSDDLISDSELYHHYVDLAACLQDSPLDTETVDNATRQVAADYHEPVAGASKRLINILEIMVYAHYASVLRKRSDDMLTNIL